MNTHTYIHMYTVYSGW